MYQRDPQTTFLTSTSDALGRVTTFAYDYKSTIQSITRAYGTVDAATTSYTYDPTFNRLASITDPLTHVKTIAIDPPTGNTTSITFPVGYQITFTYNPAGQPMNVSDNSETASFSYKLGLLDSTTDGLGNTSRFTYDAVGRLLTAADPTGATVSYTFDNLNRVVQITDPLHASTSYSYDTDGNLLTLTGSRVNTTTYTYTNLNRPAARKDPLQHSDSRVYDLNGNISVYTDRKGQVTRYSYDSLDRLTHVFFDHLSTAPYTYDNADPVTPIAH